MRTSIAWTLLFAAAFFVAAASTVRAQEPIRIGLIGLDTSHSVAFTRILNDPRNDLHVAGGRIVAAFPGGSLDIPSSYERLPGYREELETKWGIRMTDSIPELLEQVDAVMLLSLDGRKHLEQVRPVLAAKKPVFVDKPLAGSLVEAREIVRLAREAAVPFFSASSLRFFSGVAKLTREPGLQQIIGVDAFSPASLEPHHPDLYWYGIHGVEILFTLMGPGCEKVFRMFSEDGEVVVGYWADGRIGTFRGTRKGTHGYGARVIGTEGLYESDPVDGSIYRGLIEKVVEFFRTGVAPVPAEETLEIFEFMTAAQISREQNRVVELKEVR